MKKSKIPKIGIVGATGAVGQAVRSILESRKFPVSGARFFASPQSLGKTILFNGQEVPCEVLSEGCFADLDMVFFDVSDELTNEWVPLAAEQGAWVIDSSAPFRLREGTPLIVPEVNGEVLRNHLRRGNLTSQDRILTGPNCSTAQLVLPLKAILDQWGLKRVIVSTYQSTSGGGAKASEELKEQTRQVLEGASLEKVASQYFPHVIAFNCIPQVGGFDEWGVTSEERKMIDESRKLLDLPDLAMTVTAVRVPTLNCHGESVHLETETVFELEDVRKALMAFDGVELQDDPQGAQYPLPVACAGKDPVFVGRVRVDPTVKNGLQFWVVSDNLRKGAALNAVQIGEILYQECFS